MGVSKRGGEGCGEGIEYVDIRKALDFNMIFCIPDVLYSR